MPLLGHQYRAAVVAGLAASLMCSAFSQTVSIVDKPTSGSNPLYYTSSRAPLQSTPFIKLPVTAFRPSGWLLRCMDLQKDGLAGQLGEISVWLTKKNNAWLNKDGKGDYGWEEVPYWLRGYSRMAYILNDPAMIKESQIWIDGTLASQRDDGDFGPIRMHAPEMRDLWAQMLMLQVLQGYYEYSHDERVIPFMTRYFKWEMTVPDAHFLKDYWENSRGGDNIASAYWLYNITGDAFLLDLATKIDRNTANWRQRNAVPNWHVVNIAECFREPATYFLQSGKASDLKASYDNFRFVRKVYGQVPGGMFGADENARPGHDDPHQASETCSMVEEILSNGILTSITGDPMWAENSEDVAFNTFPAALTPDARALRYLTAPNQVVSDAQNHAPGLANDGPFMLMNPFSSRCCQHNHVSGWANFCEYAWYATPDKGLAAVLYSAGAVTAKVGDGTETKITLTTHYPFQESIAFAVEPAKAVSFPLYLRVPTWATGANAELNGKKLDTTLVAGKMLRIERTWNPGDKLTLNLPMHLSVRKWEKNQNSVSVNYGPLTFSLKIGEEYRKVDSTKTAMGDSGWQPGADPQKWPSFEILPTTPWNFGLLVDQAHPERSFKVVHKAWPADDYPFTNGSAPIELIGAGKEIPEWKLDEDGLVAELMHSPVTTSAKKSTLTLVPMGGARLRISAFPTVK